MIRTSSPQLTRVPRRAPPTKLMLAKPKCLLAAQPHSQDKCPPAAQAHSQVTRRPRRRTRGKAKMGPRARARGKTTTRVERAHGRETKGRARTVTKTADSTGLP